MQLINKYIQFQKITLTIKKVRHSCTAGPLICLPLGPYRGHLGVSDFFFFGTTTLVLPLLLLGLLGSSLCRDPCFFHHVHRCRRCCTTHRHLPPLRAVFSFLESPHLPRVTNPRLKIDFRLMENLATRTMDRTSFSKKS